MSVTKKVIITLTILLTSALIAGFIHVNNIATGNLPNWDPEDYVSVDVNGMTFSVGLRGDKSHTPVILLHGFPETAVMWERFMDELAANDYYAIAPNQRGYSSGARPTDISAYEIDHLASDVLLIADKLNIQRFHLIGHDWGAGVGWQLAAAHSDRVLSYVALSVPHIESFSKAYREDPDQYESSDYMRFFQNKLAPEYALANNDYEMLQSVWNKHESEEIEHYLKIFKQENALTGALNWYRANFTAIEQGADIGEVNIPTTFIWGNQDEALKRSGIAGTKDLVTGDYEFIEMEAGHWIIQEKYDELVPHLMGHLAKYR